MENTLTIDNVTLSLNLGYLHGENLWSLRNITFLIDCLEELPFWNRMNFKGGTSYDSNSYPIGTREEIIAFCQQEYDDVIAFGEQKTTEEEANVTITVGGNGGYIIINVRGNLCFWKPYKKHIFSHCKKFISRIHNHFYKQSKTSAGMGLSISGLSFWRHKRPTVDNIWIEDQVIDIVDANFFSKHVEPYQFENFHIAKAKELPSIASRSKEGELIIITWVKDLFNLEEVAKALSIREQWLVNHLTIKNFDYRFNTFGDRMDDSIGLRSGSHEDPAITLYNKERSRAYKGVVLDLLTNTLEPSLVAMLNKWKRNGRTEHGTPIKSIRLILPDRDSAVLVDQQYSNLVDAVLYIDDKDTLWAVNPSTFIAG